jgi:hypothetical protein
VRKRSVEDLMGSCKSFRVLLHRSSDGKNELQRKNLEELRLVLFLFLQRVLAHAWRRSRR